MNGIVLQGIGGYYNVMADRKTFICRVQKKIRRVGAPVVGDNVIFSIGSTADDFGWIEEVLPRKNKLERPDVANIDQLAIVVAPTPQPDFLAIEKMILYARMVDIEPLIIVNKSDINTLIYDSLIDDYKGTNIKVFSVSALEGTGVTSLKNYFNGSIICFAGQSAVGKSSLLNTMFGFGLKTGELSRKIDRGKHTTRSSQLFSVNGYNVIDTPGFSLLNIYTANPTSIPSYYPEFSLYADKCQFKPCMHFNEPGCAVLKAISENILSKNRHFRYKDILVQIKQNWKGRYH